MNEVGMRDTCYLVVTLDLAAVAIRLHFVFFRNISCKSVCFEKKRNFRRLWGCVIGFSFCPSVV